MFVFINEHSREQTSCIATDGSTQKQRFNSFTITETSSPTRTNAEVSLSQTGFYEYKIYEQNSDSNLDPDNAGGLLEKGYLKVAAPAEIINRYTEKDSDYSVYDG